MAHKKATISDIAVAAGVSKTTVSRYINGRTDLIKPATAERIEKAIQLAHYQPSAVARSLKTQRSYLVGVVVANIATPFATSLVGGITAGLAKGGYTPIFADAGDSAETERSLVDSLVSHQIDGLIMNTCAEDNPSLISLANAGTPVVLVDREVRDYNFDIVAVPYREPTLRLMDHGRAQGYTRCAFFTQPYEGNSPRRERLEAYLEGARSTFGAVRPENDVYVVDPWEPETVDEAARHLAERLGDGDRVLVQATNTVTLIAAHNALAKAGLSMPEQAGVCGPDDWGWAHRMGWDWPGLFPDGVSTYNTDPEAMGLAAAELLMGRIVDPSGKKERRYVPVRMQLR